MGIYVNPGNNNFQRILRSEIYVDKTELLEYTNSVLDTDNAYLCISRPRRFGKSITADMLSAYYSLECDSKEIFQNLKIASSLDFEKHLNKYFVIHVDMNEFRYRRDRETGQPVTAMKSVSLFHIEIIKELQEHFPDSVTDMDNDLPLVLANIYQDNGIKFIIIIDEWDTIFREDKQDFNAQKEYIELLRGLFKTANSKKFLLLAYLTGILPIKKYGTESALNNFDEFTMICPDMLSEYVGFTEQEVQDLYHSYHMDFEMAKQWYDGYVFDGDLHIYNPKSVVDSIRRKKIANYWTKTETYESLKIYISMNFDGLKEAIVKMISGGTCKVDTNTFENDMTSFQSKDDVLTVLIHLGYLAYNADTEEVFIPNKEVNSAFSKAVKKSGWNQVIQAIEDSEKLLWATWHMDEKEVAKGIEKVHMENTSILKYNDENSLSCIISLAYYHAMNEYILIREMPTGKGYADVVFLPRKQSDKPALIVELKFNQSARGAIEQIKKKQYIKALEEYKGNLLLVGVNYDKEKKEYQCKIEKVEK